MNPCIPAVWDGFTIEYAYESATYTIEVRNPAHVEHGVKSVTVDGAAAADGVVHLVSDGVPHRVVVVPQLVSIDHRERATFKKHASKWVFVDGVELKGPPVRNEGPKAGRNDPCPCGSGKKYKKCHGAS